MDEANRRLGLRAVLGVAAVVFVAAVFWAASALAAGGTSSNGGARDSPAAENVQSQGEAPDDDCPNRDGDTGSSTEV